MGLDFMSMISGIFSGGSEAKKISNYYHDIEVNSGHAYNYYNEGFIQKTATQHWTKYLDYITVEEATQIWNEYVFPAVAQDPYYGGLDRCYKSKYTGWNECTVPAVGITELLDKYIDQKLGYLSEEQAKEIEAAKLKAEEQAKEIEAAKQEIQPSETKITTEKIKSLLTSENIKKYLPYGLIGVGLLFVVIILFKRRE